MKRITAIILCFFSVISLCGCKTVLELPEGEWYCEKLRLQISQNPENEYMILDDGDKMQCNSGQLPGSSQIVVNCYEKVPEYSFGEVVFNGIIISIDVDIVRIQDRYTDVVYDFVKQ